MNETDNIDKPFSREKFISDIEKFCEREDLAPTKVGVMIFNDSAFYGKLIREKRSPTLERIEKFYDFVANYGQQDLFS